MEQVTALGDPEEWLARQAMVPAERQAAEPLEVEQQGSSGEVGTVALSTLFALLDEKDERIFM